ncbi:uncharacterized protein LOC144133211 isoform X1 [Amblyomma americanum]
MQRQQQQRAGDAAAAGAPSSPQQQPSQPEVPRRGPRRKSKGAVAPAAGLASPSQQPARFEALRRRADRSSAAVSYRLRRSAALHSRSSTESGGGDAAAMHNHTPQIDFERLVALVRPFPYLYDRTEPEFKDVALKSHRWQLIGAEFGITGEHAAQKFRTMKTKYKDLRRARELAGVAAVGRPRWRYYDLMDDFMGTRERETDSGSAEPVMVISNIFSVAEASASGADPEREAAIVPEVLPDERAADDGPPRKKIKPEPREEDEDEDESRDTQRTNESGGDEQLLLDGDSLGSNHQLPPERLPERPPERLHRAAMDNGAASTSASAGTLDAFHFFGMMIADRLRLLPRGTALRALNAMHQVLFEHETGSQR